MIVGVTAAVDGIDAGEERVLEDLGTEAFDAGEVAAGGADVRGRDGVGDADGLFEGEAELEGVREFVAIVVVEQAGVGRVRGLWPDVGKVGAVVERRVGEGSDAAVGEVVGGEGGAGEGITEIVEHPEAGAEDGAAGAEGLVGDADGGAKLP